MNTLSTILSSTLFIILGIECLCPVKIHAQIFGEAARTEFFGGLGIRTFYGRINKTQLLMNGDEISNAEAPKVFVDVAPIAFVYGALPKLSLIAVVPTMSRSFERTVNGQRLSDSDFGIGDITLFAKYRFYKKDRFANSRQAALQFGLKLPTGADDLADEQGNRFPQPLQLGSGAISYRLILTFTELRARMAFSGDVGFDLKTQAHDFDFGDVFNYDLAMKYRIHPSRYTGKFPTHDLFVFLELNGIVSQKAKSNGNEIADSGGHQIFVAPGFQYFAFENILFEAGVQIPVRQDLNGTQLGADFNFRAGLRWFILP